MLRFITKENLELYIKFNQRFKEIEKEIETLPQHDESDSESDDEYSFEPSRQELLRMYSPKTFIEHKFEEKVKVYSLMSKLTASPTYQELHAPNK